MSLLSGSLLAGLGGRNIHNYKKSQASDSSPCPLSQAWCWSPKRCVGASESSQRRCQMCPNSTEINWNQLKSTEINWSQLKSTEINWNQLKTMELGPHFTCGSPVRLDHDAGASARWQVQGRWLLGSCKEGTASPVGDHSRGVALVVPPIPYVYLLVD